MIISSVDYLNIPEIAAYMRENGLRAEFRVSRSLDRDGNRILFPKDTWDKDRYEKMMDCTKRITEMLNADL